MSQPPTTTLREAAARYCEFEGLSPGAPSYEQCYRDFLAGAKWEAERTRGKSAYEASAHICKHGVPIEWTHHVCPEHPGATLLAPDGEKS